MMEQDDDGGEEEEDWERDGEREKKRLEQRYPCLGDMMTSGPCVRTAKCFLSSRSSSVCCMTTATTCSLASHLDLCFLPFSKTLSQFPVSGALVFSRRHRLVASSHPISLQPLRYYHNNIEAVPLTMTTKYATINLNGGDCLR